MDHYKIVQDPEALGAFVDWLPELEPGEAFILSLMARKKYSLPGQGITNDRNQLARVSCKKQNLIEHIRRMEVPLDVYTARGVCIPQQALALYITPNPRSQAKAARALLETLLGAVLDSTNTYNVPALALSALQTNVSRRLLLDIDIDGMGVAQVLPLLEGLINPEAVDILETRGGVHLLVHPAKVDPAFVSTWWKSLTTLPGVDGHGDQLLPVPGCIQGGFVPKLIQFEPQWILR